MSCLDEVIFCYLVQHCFTIVIKCNCRGLRFYPIYDVNQSIAKDGICPPDKPLMDREGICYPCDAPIAIGLELNERLCTQACPKQRAMINGYCQLLKK